MYQLGMEFWSYNCIHEKIKSRARDMAQWLRVMAAFPENPCSMLSSQPSIILVLGYPNDLFLTLGHALGAQTYM